MSGGKTRDGGCMVGGSVFYAAEARETSNVRTDAEDAIEHLDKELQENENRRYEAERLEQQLSSLVWICTSTQKMSKVTVIDANNPADILDVFNVCQGHLLCIASVPGAKESDYTQSSNDNSIRTTNGTNDSENNNGVNEDVTNANEAVEQNGQRNHQSAEVLIDKSKNESENPTEDQANENVEKIAAETDQNSTNEAQSLESVDSETANLGKVHYVRCNADTILPRSNGKDTMDEETRNEEVAEETPIEKMSSVQPTMWLGAQNGAVYVHSAVAKWSVCLHSVKLRDAALAIVYVVFRNSVNRATIHRVERRIFDLFFFFLPRHVQGRVLVALADGTVTIFRRGADGQWDLSQYHVITLGSPQHSIRCMAAVSGKTVWCGYRNKIHVIDPISMILEVTSIKINIKLIKEGKREKQFRVLRSL